MSATVTAKESAFSVPPGQKGIPLKVISLNVRCDVPSDAPHDWASRLDLMVSFLQEQAPDFVGLQEPRHHQLKDILSACPEFAAIGVGRDDGDTDGEFTAILYRHDRFAPLERDTFWLSDTPEIIASITWDHTFTRTCTWCRFAIRDTDRHATVCNTHLDHESQLAREKAAALIQERVISRSHPEEPFVLTGDFNAGEANPAVRALSRQLIDTFRTLHPDTSDVGTFHAFTGRCEPDKIDYIFTSGPVRVEAATIHRPRPEGRFISDHEPVSACLRV